jgi:hypothetical protein
MALVYQPRVKAPVVGAEAMRALLAWLTVDMARTAEVGVGASPGPLSPAALVQAARPITRAFADLVRAGRRQTQTARRAQHDNGEGRLRARPPPSPHSPEGAPHSQTFHSPLPAQGQGFLAQTANSSVRKPSPPRYTHTYKVSVFVWC